VSLSKEAQYRRPLGRYFKTCPVSGYLSIGAPLGNLEGIPLPGLLRERGNIPGLFSWT
jgi:hypothetical protein